MTSLIPELARPFRAFGRMRVSIIFFFLFLPIAVSAQTGNTYKNLFWQQLGNSCQSGVTWKKSVFDLKGDTPKVPQTKEYSLNCSTGEFISINGDNGPLPSPDEFDFLFEYEASNRYIVDYFDVIEDAKGFLAVVKKESVEDTPLQHQEFKLNGSGKLRYAQSQILKDNMLYSLKVTIEVWFDDQGRYEKHKVETETDPIAQDGIHTLIEAIIEK